MAIFPRVFTTEELIENALAEKEQAEKKQKWKDISRYEPVSTTFLTEMEEYIDFDLLSHNPHVKEEQMQSFASKLKCEYLLIKNFPLQEETFQSILPYIHWGKVLYLFKRNPIGFLRSKVDKLNIRSAPSMEANILGTKNIFFRTDVYEEKDGWYRIEHGEWVIGNAMYVDFTPKENVETIDEHVFFPFIKKYHAYMDWGRIFILHLFSEKEMNELVNIVSLNHDAWISIAISQTLSEDFMEKHRDKLPWKLIAEHQTFSSAFAKKYEAALGKKVVKQALKTEKSQKKSTRGFSFTNWF